MNSSSAWRFDWCRRSTYLVMRDLSGGTDRGINPTLSPAAVRGTTRFRSIREPGGGENACAYAHQLSGTAEGHLLVEVLYWL